MGRTKRTYQQTINVLSKSLKKPLLQVASLMPKGFTNQMFIEEFKALYIYLWEDLESKYTEYKRMDDGLARKEFPKRYFFPLPANYIIKRSHAILCNTRFNHSKDTFLSEDERLAKREVLIAECSRKVKKRQEKLEENLKLVQEITPIYTNYFINEYFRLNHNKPEDVTSRYVLLQEAAKYKCTSTLKFLNRVNASERNFTLRHFAFLTLQQFGEKEVRLRKNRKGKKRLGDNLSPDKIETPSQLLNHIYSSQLEKEKKYDIFLSHSSSNKELILSIKTYLNTLNLNIYVDWINDKEGLKRDLTNVNTAEVIIERLKSCKALLFVFTEESMNSFWTPWEIGYFHSLNGKICIFFSNDKDKGQIPAYLEMYPAISFVDNELIIKNKESNTQLLEWLYN